VTSSVPFKHFSIIEGGTSPKVEASLAGGGGCGSVEEEDKGRSVIFTGASFREQISSFR
jgi:hypothetical protein